MTTPHDQRRVLLLERGFMRPRRGRPVHGVELHRLLAIRALVSRGVELTVPLERSWRPILEERLGDDMPRIIEIPYMRRRSLTALAGAFTVMRSRYDVLLLGDPDNGIVPAIELLHIGPVAPRTLMLSHGELKRRLLARVVRRRRFDILANSRLVADRFRPWSRGRLSIMYGLPDAERFTPRAEPRPEGEPIRFGLMGKLPSPSKGVETALAAFDMLPDDVRAGSELHIIGYDEPPAPPAPDVHMRRWVPGAEIPETLRGLDIMLIPSTWESFSQVSVQAMLTALPILVSDIAVLSEKVDEGGGVICPDAASLAEAMTDLARNPDKRRRMGASARETALRRYVWDADRFINEHLFPQRSETEQASTQQQ
ncbi:MAG: glycosyltransferase [Phycisphaeraceae bacterium]|nr:MAG: glycosyltransferase [Phycisphaeraceae bacterium]